MLGIVLWVELQHNVHSYSHTLLLQTARKAVQRMLLQKRLRAAVVEAEFCMLQPA